MSKETCLRLQSQFCTLYSAKDFAWVSQKFHLTQLGHQGKEEQFPM